MSYPRKLQILVVEDDSDVITGYRTTFKLLKKKFEFVDPVFARSFADAKKQIESSAIWHVVILDLNLPLELRQQPAQGLAPGEQLLEELVKRERFPVPVVLVVSGKLNLDHPLGAIQNRLGHDFWYGRLVNKGSSDEQNEIEAGMTHALQYVDVGIHIGDSGREWFPTLSPREDDLLRRCVLAQSSCLGVNVRWWSAETGPSVLHPSPNAGGTKVLMGTFVLDEGMGDSIPTFFKFEPAENAPTVCRDAGILAQKLGHVKVFSSLNSRQRSLLVTQSATNRGIPVSLNEFLNRTASVVSPSLPSLIGQVITQLGQLGEEREDEFPVGNFLWEYLEPHVIEKVWNSCISHSAITGEEANPLETFKLLKTSSLKHWAKQRTCVHGDLNATNVAIDATQPENPQAYIFDAAGMRSDYAFRDLATLEITTILFNSVGVDEELVAQCRGFYEQDFNPALPAPSAPCVQNVFTLVGSIRSYVRTDQEKITYALLVFDAAIPVHACQLAAWASRWLRHVAPDIFDSSFPSNTHAAETSESNTRD